DFKGIWRAMHPGLKRLLAADCLARWAEGLPGVFMILYVVQVLQRDSFTFGWLTSLEMTAAILVYIPVARMAGRMNRKPFVLLTFAFFALFPLLVAWGVNLFWLTLAFVIGGLRETGEPARKALI